tara:strand:- start:9741 stop:10028 length:288 start_codon:yes stop_codon:yes gene_type:complete
MLDHRTIVPALTVIACIALAIAVVVFGSGCTPGSTASEAYRRMKGPAEIQIVTPWGTNIVKVEEGGEIHSGPDHPDFYTDETEEEVADVPVEAVE